MSENLYENNKRLRMNCNLKGIVHPKRKTDTKEDILNNAGKKKVLFPNFPMISIL